MFVAVVVVAVGFWGVVECQVTFISASFSIMGATSVFRFCFSFILFFLLIYALAAAILLRIIN